MIQLRDGDTVIELDSSDGSFVFDETPPAFDITLTRGSRSVTFAGVRLTVTAPRTSWTRAQRRAERRANRCRERIAARAPRPVTPADLRRALWWDCGNPWLTLRFRADRFPTPSGGWRRRGLVHRPWGFGDPVLDPRGWKYVNIERRGRFVLVDLISYGNPDTYSPQELAKTLEETAMHVNERHGRVRIMGRPR